MTKSFPINDIKHSLLTAIESDPLVVLTAPTGAGKSTVLPLWLLASNFCQGDKKVYLLQPRRVAAKNIACYLAAQLGEKVGERVGYRLRNESKVSKHTRLEVITEGILVRLMQNDPELINCSLIVFDEFHERSLQADIAFAIARDIQQGLRDDLHILLMSATLAIGDIQKSLPDASFVESQGLSFPVSYQYLPPSNIRAWRQHCLSVIIKTLNDVNASILVFLPSSNDIRWLAEQLEAVMAEQYADSFELFSLYGDLPLKEQQKAIQVSENQRHKLVLATNIAETSLTIEGIECVIDSGLENVAVFDSATLTNQLKQQAICKASAIQRAGRAGRISAGTCIRLYSADDFQRRPEQATLAIEQADLLPILIEAAQWGVTALSQLPILTLPKIQTEEGGWQTLQQLNIVDNNKQLTSIGKSIAKLSCHPRFANMIISAGELENRLATADAMKKTNLVSLACLIAALLEEKDILYGEQAKFNACLFYRLELLRTSHTSQKQNARCARILKQANNLARQANSCFSFDLNFDFSFDSADVGLLLALAFPERIAQKRQRANQQTSQQDYLAANGKGLSLNLDDKLADEDYLVIANASQFNQKLNIRLAAPVNVQQLIDAGIIEPSWQQVLFYDDKTNKIIAEKRHMFGAIIFATQAETAQLNAEKIVDLWCQQITKFGLSWLNWQKQDTELLARLRWLTQEFSELTLGDYSEQALLANTEELLAPYLTDIRTKSQLDKLDLSEILLANLSYQQQQLVNELAPTFYVGPTGRKCKISYSETSPPIVELPMQEVYGLQISPSVGLTKFGKEIPLTLSLLSPAGRPIQVTQDLSAFWQGSYKEVQKEMKGRYPKHFWPDDPANAKATNKTKRNM